MLVNCVIVIDVKGRVIEEEKYLKNFLFIVIFFYLIYLNIFICFKIFNIFNVCFLEIFMENKFCYK